MYDAVDYKRRYPSVAVCKNPAAKEMRMGTKVIRKYELEDLSTRTGYCSYTRVDIPKGGRVIGLSYSSVDYKTYLHVVVDTTHRLKQRWFATFEEGMPMEDYERKTFDYIGRVGVDPEQYVFEVHD